MFTVSLYTFICWCWLWTSPSYLISQIPLHLPTLSSPEKTYSFNCWLPSTIVFMLNLFCVIHCVFVYTCLFNVVDFVVDSVLNSLCSIFICTVKNFPVVCFRCDADAIHTPKIHKTPTKRHVSTCSALDFHWRLGRCLQKPIVFIGYLHEAAAAYAKTKCYKTHN